MLCVDILVGIVLPFDIFDVERVSSDLACVNVGGSGVVLRPDTLAGGGTAFYINTNVDVDGGWGKDSSAGGDFRVPWVAMSILTRAAAGTIAGGLV